jgi:hypothetical protein
MRNRVSSAAGTPLSPVDVCHHQAEEGRGHCVPDSPPLPSLIAADPCPPNTQRLLPRVNKSLVFKQLASDYRLVWIVDVVDGCVQR